jgi:hypothetical protein
MSDESLPVNPYQPPVEADRLSWPVDPLRFPAWGIVVCSFLPLVLSLVGIVIAIRLIYLYGEFPEPTDTIRKAIREAYDMLLFSPLLMVFGLLGFLCARCLLARKWRWFVVSYCVLTLLPFSGWFLAPLGIITLMRLWQKDVWNSFLVHATPAA